jgi:hypothetical protein
MFLATTAEAVAARLRPLWAERLIVAAVPAAALAAASLSVSAPASAQGLRLMQECAPHLQPLVSEAPDFPAHGPYRYRVSVQFIIDIGGSVLAPRIKSWEFVEGGGAAATAPSGFEAAFLAAFAKWKYARQGRPCSATAELAFGTKR